MLALLTWLPKLRPANEVLTEDMLFEQTTQQVLCGVGAITGWPINDGSIGATLGTFAPTLPRFLVVGTAYLMAHFLPISDEQTFLNVGISLSMTTTYIASRSVEQARRPKNRRQHSH